MSAFTEMNIFSALANNLPRRAAQNLQIVGEQIRLDR